MSIYSAFHIRDARSPSLCIYLPTRCLPSLPVTSTRLLVVLAAAPSPPSMCQALRIMSSK